MSTLPFMRHCSICDSDLEKTGVTSTHHDVLTCPVCELSWVAYYDELQPIEEQVDLSSHVNPITETRF